MRIMPNHYSIESSYLVTTVGEAPVGLLQLNDGTIICKSEYRTNGRCECTIVSSGENYCGDGDEAQCIPFELVRDESRMRMGSDDDAPEDEDLLCKDCVSSAVFGKVRHWRCTFAFKPEKSLIDGSVDYSCCPFCRAERKEDGGCGPSGCNFEQSEDARKD